MTAEGSIATPPLRELVYERLRDEIMEGARSPRVRLMDTALAASLGVSRTPVREALLRLASEGFLRADHQRGFRVPDFDPGEVRDTYPIIAALEAAGLRSSGPPDGDSLDHLRAINRRLGQATGARVRLRIDQEWHCALVERSGNRRLLRTLSTQKSVVRRYENRYMKNVGRVLGSVAEHEGIVAALESGDVELACRRLEAHWEQGMAKVLEWIEA